MSGVLVPCETGGITVEVECRAVNSLHFRAIAGRTPFSLTGSSLAPFFRRRFRRQKTIRIPMRTSPAMAPANPPIMACLRCAVALCDPLFVALKLGIPVTCARGLCVRRLSVSVGVPMTPFDAFRVLVDELDVEVIPALLGGFEGAVGDASDVGVNSLDVVLGVGSGEVVSAPLSVFVRTTSVVR